jgi:predicted nucleotide-binding protein (sugar kinase/HSP70/actin superfamily)
MTEEVIRELIEYLKIYNDINKVKYIFSQKIGRVLKNIEILKYLEKNEEELIKILRSIC